MRFVIKYTKEDPIKYISHLDLMRLLQRAMRRASIPIAYSKGFNPHPQMSFASALAVGVTSQGEYLDIFLEEYMDPEQLRLRMNEKLPQGIQFLEVKRLDDDCPSLMSLIERAKYLFEISVDTQNEVHIPPLIEGFLSQEKVLVTKKTKKGSQKTDIRPMIHRLEPDICTPETITMKAIISSGSRGNLRPDLLLEALMDYGGMEPDTHFRIHRKDLYLFKDGRWITPVDMGQGGGH